MQTMLDQGWLGVKSGTGFYKRVVQDGGKEFWPLDLDTLEHRPPRKPRFDSVGAVKDLETALERIGALLVADDRAADLVRALLYHSLAYASLKVPEIADTARPIDNAVRWGFTHELGPFETWDALGVKATTEAMKEAGYQPAAWVEEMLAAGIESFYEYEGPRRVSVYDPELKACRPIPTDKNVIVLSSLKSEDGVIESNDGASLLDVGDGVALLEFHTKANALDVDILQMLDRALEITARDFEGLIVGNQAENFSAGANLFAFAVAAQNELWDQLEEVVFTFQELNMRMRYSDKPIVVAPSGMTLAGGCELMMAGSKVIAAAESYIGLVEVGAGVIPAGTGCKEMLRRVVNPAMKTKNADDLPFLQRVFETVGQAKVGTSAEESRRLGYLTESDRVIMNRDHVIGEAKREVLSENRSMQAAERRSQR